MIPAIRVLVGTGLLFLASACATEARKNDLVQHSDSSSAGGRTILTENDVDFVLEGLDVGGTAPVSDEEFAILDYRGRRVVIFDTTGAVVRIIGKEGGGPGELLFPQMLVPMLGERIGVLDGRKSALVVYSHGGSPVSQYALDTLVGISPTRIIGLRQVAPNEWMIAERASEANTRYEKLSRRRGRESHGVDSTRAAATTPTIYPCNVVVESGEAPVFWPTLRWDAVPGLHAIVTGAPYTVKVGRDAMHTRSFPVEPRRADRAAALRERLGGTVRVGQTECRLTREEALDQRTMSEVIPVVRAVRVSPAREVWIQRDAAHGERRPIDVLDSTGAKLATHAGIAMPLFFLTESTYVAMDSTPSGDLALTLWRVRGGRR